MYGEKQKRFNPYDGSVIANKQALIESLGEKLSGIRHRLKDAQKSLDSAVAAGNQEQIAKYTALVEKRNSIMMAIQNTIETQQKLIGR